MSGTPAKEPESPRKEVERVESLEEVRWKLVICETCRQRRMMPTTNTACLQCERESRDVVLSADDIRWIIAYRDPASFVRGAWKLASASTNAAMGLDLRNGMVTVHRWRAGENMPETEDEIILAVCPASRRAELPQLLAVGSEGLLGEEAAEELAVEVVVRAALGDGGERFWAGVDEQLRERAQK